MLDDLVRVFVLLSHDADDGSLLAEHLVLHAHLNQFLRVCAAALELLNAVMYSQFQQVSFGGLGDRMEVFSCENEIDIFFLFFALSVQAENEFSEICLFNESGCDNQFVAVKFANVFQA